MEFNGVKVTISRIAPNLYRLTEPSGQSIEIAAVGILEIVIYADVNNETVETDACTEAHPELLIP